MSTDKIMYNPHKLYIILTYYIFDPHKLSRDAILCVWFIKLKVTANKYIITRRQVYLLDDRLSKPTFVLLEELAI